jgi:hypothetical protein
MSILNVFPYDRYADEEECDDSIIEKLPSYAPPHTLHNLLTQRRFDSSMLFFILTRSNWNRQYYSLSISLLLVLCVVNLSYIYIAYILYSQNPKLNPNIEKYSFHISTNKHHQNNNQFIILQFILMIFLSMIGYLPYYRLLKVFFMQLYGFEKLSYKEYLFPILYCLCNLLDLLSILCSIVIGLYLIHSTTTDYLTSSSSSTTTLSSTTNPAFLLLQTTLIMSFFVSSKEYLLSSLLKCFAVIFQREYLEEQLQQFIFKYDCTYVENYSFVRWKRYRMRLILLASIAYVLGVLFFLYEYHCAMLWNYCY